MPLNEEFELLADLEDDVVRLMEAHKERRKDWYFHELVPWERGESFADKPWDESQATVAPEVRTALVLNLLTEDNLPYYHEVIGRFMPNGSAFKAWNNLWTAEEGQHAIAIRSYLLTSRNCDPDELEDDRKQTMTNGYEPPWDSPAELFAYTSAQELATRISHRNTGKLTDDPAAFELMKKIAQDENHHFLFYRGMMSAILREAPSIGIQAIHRVLTNFEMPGTSMPRFLRRSIEVAKAGVYNLQVHHDNVLAPLLREWQIGDVLGLTPKAQELQEQLMALPEQILQQAERFERRLGIQPA